MPLLDHFHPPLSQRRHWESFHAAWAGSLVDALNQRVLPRGFVAEEQVHAGAQIEIDVATFEETASAPPNASGGATALAAAVWTPAAAPLVMPASFPEGVTVEVWNTDGGMRLVGVLEIVSPGNKDRAIKRRLFAAKCATYLAKGIGLVIVDIVTNRRANLHNELADLMGLEAALRMPADQSLYAAAYRPLRIEQAELVHLWPTPLAVGQPLPTVPLSLEAERCVAVDLEAAYLDACQRRRVDEVLG